MSVVDEPKETPAPERGEVTSGRQWPLLALIVARLREFYREPEAVFWVYGFPVLMVIALGVAFRTQPEREITVDVIEGADAAALLGQLSPDGHFKSRAVSLEEGRRRLRGAKTDVVVIPLTGPSAGIEYLFDPTRPESVSARGQVDDRLQRAAGRTDKVVTKNVPFAELGGRYIDYLVPGLLGVGLMGGGLWGVGFVTVDMRIRKLLKRFLATPMNRGDFLAAVMISRMIFMVPEVLFLLIFSRFAFEVVIRGSYLAVATLVVLGAVTFSGLGLLVASRAKTVEAVSGLMNLVMVPMWVMSGIFFSWERFPTIAHPFIQALPLTALIDALRAVMLDGLSLASQAGRVGILLAWASVSFSLALRWFRWI